MMVGVGTDPIIVKLLIMVTEAVLRPVRRNAKNLRNVLHSPMKLLQLRTSIITATYMKEGHTRMEVVGPILHVTYWNKFV